MSSRCTPQVRKPISRRQRSAKCAPPSADLWPARAVRYLAGVVSVFNAITLKPQTSASQVKDKVVAALQRHATADAKSIHVDASGGKVTLTGHPSSWQAIEDAVDAAWAAPGVTEVDDQMQSQ